MNCLESYKLKNSDTRQSELLSKTITFLKFPLAVFVVLLHANLLAKPTDIIGIFDLAANYPVFSSITWFFSRFLAYSAVPAFFIISGFLLFYNVDHFDRIVYVSKMKRRVKSLVIPYVVWNLLYFLILRFMSPENIPLFDLYDFQHENNPIKYIFELFIRPIDGPLWFIRNLVVMTFISPLFYYAARKFKLALPICFFVLTQLLNSPIVESLLWYSTGVTLSVMRIDFLRLCRDSIQWSFIILAVVMVVDLTGCYFTGEHNIIGHFSIFKIMLVLGIGYWIIEQKPAFADFKPLSNSTFVIYAYHGAPLSWLLGVSLPILIRYGEIGVVLCYLLSVFAIVIAGIVLSSFIHKSKLLTRLLIGR